jgi:hypothetical protein
MADMTVPQDKRLGHPISCHVEPGANDPMESHDEP